MTRQARDFLLSLGFSSTIVLMIELASVVFDTCGLSPISLNSLKSKETQSREIEVDIEAYLLNGIYLIGCLTGAGLKLDVGFVMAEGFGTPCLLEFIGGKVVEPCALYF